MGSPNVIPGTTILTAGPAPNTIGVPTSSPAVVGTTVVNPTAPIAKPQIDISQLIGLLFTMGVAAASIFVKNPAHQQTAGSIINVLNSLLPTVEAVVKPPSGT